MSGKETAPQEHPLKAMEKTVAEIEVLLKSWKGEQMHKDEQSEEPQEAPAEAQAPDSLEDQADQSAEQAPSEESSEQPSEAPSEEPQEGQDEQAQMEQHAAELSDEELEMMLNCLMQEKQKRQPQEGEQAPEQAPEQQEEMERSMKAEFEGLKKSFSDEITKLTKSIDAVKKENADLKKKAALPTTKPATANARPIEKTASEASVSAPLSKSETIDYLMGEMRSGNKTVKADHVATVNAVRSEEDLQEAHRRLKADGIKVPKADK